MIFAVANYTLSFKYLDSTYKLDCFYELEDNTVDVLVLGSSHSYQGFNTAVFWSDYGFSAFNLCGPAQPIWNTYFYLEEALKTQKPKAIILDTYMLYVSNEYDEAANAIKNTDGLKWSQTKIDAINASFDTEKTGNQYFFSWMQYHSRYSDLSQNDFYPYQGNEEMYKNHKGFYCYFKTTEIQNKDYSDESECSVLPEKGETYYRKIIELAKSKNIPIIITAIPFNADSFNIKYINEAQRIASEYDVPFYNFLKEHKYDLALNYETDFADKQHLNHNGNTKLTRFFGEILKKEYNITDKRGNDKYASWEADAQVYNYQLQNHSVTGLNSVAGYLQVFGNKRYTILVTMTCDDFENLSQQTKIAAEYIFTAINVKKSEYSDGGLWVWENGEVTYHNDFSNNDFSKSIRLSKSHTAHTNTELVKLDNTKEIYAKKIYINKSKQSKVYEGINIVVYDNFTQSIVDSVGINFSNGEFTR